MLKPLRQLFRHGPPRGLEASDFMDASRDALPKVSSESVMVTPV